MRANCFFKNSTPFGMITNMLPQTLNIPYFVVLSQSLQICSSNYKSYAGLKYMDSDVVNFWYPYMLQTEITLANITFVTLKIVSLIFVLWHHTCVNLFVC